MILRKTLRSVFLAASFSLTPAFFLISSSFAKAADQDEIQSGNYESVAGASFQINVGPWAGSGRELRVLGHAEIPALPLTALSSSELQFKGKGCTLLLNGLSKGLIQVMQKGVCEYYGFKPEMNLSGPMLLTSSASPIASGDYKSVAGASFQINVGPWAGSGPELRVLGHAEIPALPLTALSASKLQFKGKGCEILIDGLDETLIVVSQKGPCEYYGFGLEMNLSGPFVAVETSN